MSRARSLARDYHHASACTGFPDFDRIHAESFPLRCSSTSPPRLPFRHQPIFNCESDFTRVPLKCQREKIRTRITRKERICKINPRSSAFEFDFASTYGLGVAVAGVGSNVGNKFVAFGVGVNVGVGVG